MAPTAADPKAQIDGRINSLMSSYEQEQERKRAADAQAAEEARQERRRMIKEYFGDLWPVFEPFAAPAEIERDRRYWTRFDVEPLALAPFRFSPYLEHGQMYARYATDDRQIDAYTRQGEIDKMLIHLRGRYEDLQQGAAERAAREAAQAREAEENRRHQQQLGAEYAAAYRAYALERSRIRKHNAGLIAAWNKAHADPYQIKLIAYPVGVEDSAGEATIQIVSYPNGDWNDPEGYSLVLEYGGTVSRRRYTRLLWEEAPRTVTPGPGISGYEQRQMRVANLMIYARPAEEQIAQTAADLLAVMLPFPDAPTRPADLWSERASEIEQQIWQEIGDDAGDDAGDHLPY